MSATGRSREAGNTLVEALAVVAIAALVAMIGFPRMQQGFVVLSQRQTVAVVAAQLRELRANALRSDRPYAFAVAPDGRGYGATGGASAQTPPGVELSSRDRRGGSAALITFYGDGSSSGGSIWVSAARRSVGVFVAPATGAVRVGAG